MCEKCDEINILKFHEICRFLHEQKFAYKTTTEKIVFYKKIIFL